MRRKTRRMLFGAGAIVVALAMIVGGTFAYTLFEHKSNALRSNANYQARLVENFDPDPEWVVNEDITKQISVKNMGGTEQFRGGTWGDIYVRLQLKEHMDVTPIDYIYYPESNADEKTRFMVDKNGDFVRFAATGALEDQFATILSDAAWEKVIADPVKRAAYLSTLKQSDFIKIKGHYDQQEYWYIVTKEGDPNGQYGAFLVVKKNVDESKRTSLTNSTRATDVDYSNGMAQYDPSDHETEECLYPVHMWDVDDYPMCSMASHQYVEWTLGSSVILLDDWIDGGKQPINKWILDPTTGWATWGNAIKPGQSTDRLLEAITPIAQPDGEMFYVIHAEMEATDLFEMGDDWVIKDIFGNKTKLKFPSNPIRKNIDDPDFYHPSLASFDLDHNTLSGWTSSDTGVATVASDGKVHIVGEGTATITVTVTPDDGDPPYDISFVLIVTDNTVPTTELELKNDTFPTDPEVDLRAKSTWILLVDMQDGTLAFEDVLVAANSYSYFPLDHFLKDEILEAHKDGTKPITITVEDGAIPDANVNIVDGFDLSVVRTDGTDYRETPCIAINKLFPKADYKEPYASHIGRDTTYNVWFTEITVALHQDGLTSKPITLRVGYAGIIYA